MSLVSDDTTVSWVRLDASARTVRTCTSGGQNVTVTTIIPDGSVRSCTNRYTWDLSVLILFRRPMEL